MCGVDLLTHSCFNSYGTKYPSCSTQRRRLECWALSFELYLAINQLDQPSRLQNQHIHTYMHTNQLQRL